MKYFILLIYTFFMEGSFITHQNQNQLLQAFFLALRLLLVLGESMIGFSSSLAFSLSFESHMNSRMSHEKELFLDWHLYRLVEFAVELAAAGLEDLLQELSYWRKALSSL